MLPHCGVGVWRLEARQRCGEKVDHVSYAVEAGNIEKWAWFHIEVEGGRLIKRMRDAITAGDTQPFFDFSRMPTDWTVPAEQPKGLG